MKVFVTRKQLSANYPCISVGYCNLQHLLRFKSPRFYHHGVYGWNFDAYVLERNGRHICITTGYRSTINNCEYSSNYALEKKYDAKALEIIQANGGQRTTENVIDSLIQGYLAEVMDHV